MTWRTFSGITIQPHKLRLQYSLVLTAQPSPSSQQLKVLMGWNETISWLIRTISSRCNCKVNFWWSLVKLRIRNYYERDFSQVTNLNDDGHKTITTDRHQKGIPNSRVHSLFLFISCAGWAEMSELWNWTLHFASLAQKNAIRDKQIMSFVRSSAAFIPKMQCNLVTQLNAVYLSILLKKYMHIFKNTGHWMMSLLGELFCIIVSMLICQWWMTNCHVLGLGYVNRAKVFSQRIW